MNIFPDRLDSCPDFLQAVRDGRVFLCGAFRSQVVHTKWTFLAMHLAQTKRFLTDEESAFIDGANHFTVLIRIILPLSLPIAATIAIYSSVHHWNSWFDNQLYTVTNEKLTTLQFLLYGYLNKTEAMLEAIERGDVSDTSILMTPRGLKMTITMVTVIPILCVYPFMQRFLIKGIMIGAVKG